MKFYFLFIFLILQLFVYAQNSFVENVIDPLQKNHIYFEKVFVHTNKTTYFPHDMIWFKAYVGTRDNQPSDMTTRLHVNLLNANGERLSGKNIFIYEGTGKGQFQLKGTIDPGTYYLQAYTNYMRNFGESNYFLRAINIISNRHSKANYEEGYYEFKIFPEGSFLLEGTENVVGIKYLVDGEDIDFSGKIVNSRSKEVANFRSQYMGMAKPQFFYEPGEKYKAVINFKDTLIKVEIPAAKNRGMILSINNEDKDTLSLTLRTNKKTAEELENLNYTLLYHQRNKVVGFLQISGLDSLTAEINSDKDVFYEGVNTVTLFKGYQPVAERKFFIEKEKQEINVSLELVNATKDSLTYKLNLQKGKKPVKGQLSISVLCADANNLEEISNIESAFLLAPYISEYLKNPAYYFNDGNPKREKHLDLLLLNQNWDKPTLKEWIKKSNPRPKFNFELGFTLKGELTPPFSSNQLALISNNNQLIQKDFLSGNKNFVFEKLLLYEGDTVKIAYMDKHGKAIRPDKIYFDTLINKSYPTIEAPLKDVVKKENTVPGKSEPGENGFLSDAVKLNEILLTGRGRSESYRRRRELIEKYKHLVFDIGNYYELPLSESYKDFNNNLWWYLQYDQHVKLKNWKNRGYYLALSPDIGVILFIDGERQVNMDLLGLSSIDMEDVENIMIRPLRKLRIYQVFTTEDFKDNVERLAIEHIMKNGYDRPKKYYPPNNDFKRVVNNSLIEVAWKPEVITNNDGEVFITIPKKGTTENMLFVIQGFSEGGDLVFEIVNK